ncbi:MAG: peroxiredoxin [Candidatus Magnetominusculus sp. LBB02]|nr:peroxiredoxin [Candidatus Magnetominusculus sp. LBB02]
MIKPGDKAPEFCLDAIDAHGQKLQLCLTELLTHQKQVVLFFYPKDNTSGCTQEACDFRDNLNRITAKAVVAGVSRDSVASHQKFREKQALNFPLLSDPDHKVLELYGAWGQKMMYGKPVISTVRTTVLINKDGIINRVWTNVKVKGHVEEILGELERGA